MPTLVILNLLFLIVTLNTAYAAPKYPISELGNCRNTRECYLYCQIPANSPACWSFAKYRLNNNVLGEQTKPSKESDKLSSLSFPISELGNCASQKECFQYCVNPTNYNTCISYSKIHSLAPTDASPTPKLSPKIISVAIEELGCDSPQSCLAICGQPSYKAICQSFAQKYHLLPETKPKKISASILADAKATLGCDSEELCKTFCSNAENVSKCMEFAKTHGLANQKSLDSEVKNKMLEEAKHSLGCSSFDNCAAFCSQAQNVDRCFEFSKKFASGSSEPKIQINKTCADDKECKSYCEAHPSECPGFNTSAQTNDYLGPSGCKTEAECKSFCEKNPTACPSFPASTTTSKDLKE